MSRIYFLYVLCHSDNNTPSSVWRIFFIYIKYNVWRWCGRLCSQFDVVERRCRISIFYSMNIVRCNEWNIIIMMWKTNPCNVCCMYTIALECIRKTIDRRDCLLFDGWRGIVPFLLYVFLIFQYNIFSFTFIHSRRVVYVCAKWRFSFECSDLMRLMSITAIFFKF